MTLSAHFVNRLYSTGFLILTNEGAAMPEALPIPADALVRMDMLHRVSESRAAVNDAKPKLKQSLETPMIGDDAKCGDYHGRGLPRVAALAKAEIILADLKESKVQST